VSINTVYKLLAVAGPVCARFHDATVRGVASKRIHECAASLMRWPDRGCRMRATTVGPLPSDDLLLFSGMGKVFSRKS